MLFRRSVLRWSLALVALGLSALVQAQQKSEGEVSPPNFVIIMADDLGYGDLRCYWQDSPALTPNLDRMASEGLRFTDFHSSGNVCSPTRAGLLTGRYQQRAGIPGVINADPKVPAHFFGLGRNETTFAEALKESGYATALFGKWHLGYDVYFNPTEHGFDEFRGYVSGNVDYQSHYDRMEKFDWWNGRQLEDQNGYVTHLVTKNAIDFVESNKARPFCLYVAHEAVHAPWQGPEDPSLRGPAKIKNAKIDRKVALSQMLTEMDKSVGQILNTIENCGIAERTLVLFFSDNGPAGGSAGPLRGRKGSDYEGGHRVPAIAWWPSRIKPGQQTDALTISLDVMPTLLSLASVQDVEGLELDGEDLSPVLFGKESRVGRKLYWNERAMRDGNWKLVLQKPNSKSPQLFDLSKDLGEKKDLASEQPRRVKQMQSAIAAWKRDVADGATTQPITR